MLNGFAGKLFFNGQKAKDEDAQQLSKSLLLLPGTQREQICLGGLAVAAVCWSEGGKQILSNEDKALIGSGCIYNRDDIALMNIKYANDLELMWQAYCRWGEEAPLSLDGDWMFAAYDQSREQLILARSWGISALYYYRGIDFLAFATHPAVLASIAGVPSRPDIRSIIQMMSFLPFSPDKTCYEGIRQVQPASMLIIDQARSTERIWWRPSDIKEESCPNEEEAFEHFRMLYSSAVKKRIDTDREVGLFLSSGLDSTSVCALAASDLIPMGKALHTWTSVPHYRNEAYAPDNWLVDETSLVSRFVQQINNLHYALVDAIDTDPLEAIRLQILHVGRPQSAVANLYWISKIYRLAQEADCSVILSGQCGNYTVSWTPSNLTLFPKNRYLPGISYKKYLKVIQRFSLLNLKQLKENVSSTLFGSPDSSVFNTRFQGSDEYQKAVAANPIISNPSHSAQAEVQMGYFDTSYHTGYWNGIAERDPTMDIPLNKFVLSLPKEVFFRDGIDRRLMRLGMAGILPDDVRFNKKRGYQGSDILPRIKHFKRQAEQALRLIEGSKCAKELLDLGTCRHILDRITNGESGIELMQACTSVLLPGISCGLFLASFDSQLRLDESLS